MDVHEALKAITTASQLQYSEHARQRMNERNVTSADVQHVLKTAQLERMTKEDGEGKWAVEGTDLDEEQLTVVVVVEVLLTGKSRNYVVTVY